MVKIGRYALEVVPVWALGIGYYKTDSENRDYHCVLFLSWIFVFHTKKKL